MFGKLFYSFLLLASFLKESLKNHYINSENSEIPLDKPLCLDNISNFDSVERRGPHSPFAEKSVNPWGK